MDARQRPLRPRHERDFILVTAWPAGSAPAPLVESALPAGASIVEQRELLATARPETDEPPSKPGIYVHQLSA